MPRKKKPPLSYETKRAIRDEAKMDAALDALKAAVLKAPEDLKAALKEKLLACTNSDGLIYIDEHTSNAFWDELVNAWEDQAESL